ncbi:MAG: glucosamine-6-phosphate deaminase [Sedimentisphaerales bacterium]|nr:glucosamine-6-phosphate deaminase [Sedimentisphaerales bacterium]
MKSLEKVPVRIFANDSDVSVAVAHRIREIILAKQASGRQAVLGLATGHTPVKVYKELIRMHREEGLDFSNVVTFNLDEYWPIEREALQSYYRWMHENLFDSVNIPAENIHIPRGDVSENEIDQHCRAYEEAIAAAGGIDIQLLGIGRSGHVGFNEPGSRKSSKTRRIHLDVVTRRDAASDFFGEENVPEMAITMGVGSILAARELCLLAFGEHKAPIVKRAVEGDISDSVAASYLQEHPNATIFLDEAAAASLTRMSKPWLVGRCKWDDKLKRSAVIWLSQEIQKPILMLTDEDYSENGLYDLIRECKGSYHLNIDVFRYLMKTITGKPTGENDKQKVLVFSPHPDDDVICMGGSIMRMIERGHEVHIAYMVSGCLSVFDHDVERYAEFVREFGEIFGLPQDSEVIDKQVIQFLRSKKPGHVDTLEVQKIKGLIRRKEAVDAAKFCGLSENQTHFLELPFYNTGKVQKLSISNADVKAVLDILNELQPTVIFAAGDMSDPHGTHRLCLEAVLKAFDEYVAGGNAKPELWLYRGAWQEWSPEQIERAVPMAPDELKKKRYAIFRHQSQKDRAMFPGPYDSREFWQRSEDRNKTTAQTYDSLGLPQYYALEAFVRYPLGRSAQWKDELETVKEE